MGIDSSWFRAYLSHRKQCVYLDGQSSDFLDIECGVPQGSLLGPLLYLIYSNDMEVALSTGLTLYADDSILISIEKCPEIIKNKLEIGLKNCNNWLVNNKLTLHPDKCDLIFIKFSIILKFLPQNQ